MSDSCKDMIEAIQRHALDEEADFRDALKQDTSAAYKEWPNKAGASYHFPCLHPLSPKTMVYIYMCVLTALSTILRTFPSSEVQSSWPSAA